MTKRKPATEICLFCGRKIPDKSNTEVIREFLQRFKKIACKTTIMEYGKTDVAMYNISAQALDELADEMTREE